MPAFGRPTFVGKPDAPAQVPRALSRANVDLTSKAAIQSVQVDFVPLSLRPHHDTVGHEFIDE
jgi:hypothetical protein